ncbi:putative coiled-coil domain-containing protein 195 [Polymixia lowei]
MLKPQQSSEFRLHESPPVFGKPWYWQRSSSTMESTRSLAQVIMEMRDEIKKLETENKALRGEFGQQTFGAAPEEPSRATEHRTGMEENPYVNLRRNASAPALEGQYKENAVMTVRRYSVSSNLSEVTGREGRADRSRRSESGWGRLQEEVQHGSETDIFGSSATFEIGKLSNRHSLQEYVHKNRAKVKTVTFLLPVDDIYTNQPVLTKHQEDHKMNDLDSITETDS